MIAAVRRLILALAMCWPLAALASPRVLPVGACINLGVHLDSRDGQESAGWHLGSADMVRIHRAGFATVRLPVNWSAHAGAAAPWPIEPAWLARVAALVDAGLGAGLNVILDNHNHVGLDTAPEAEAPRLAAIWGQLARAFAGRTSAHLWFELANEPHGALTNANLIRTLGPALAAVRAVSRDRPVLIGGEDWSSLASLATLDLPDDPALYPTFHYYTPMAFTHQGAPWIVPRLPVGRDWGDAVDQALLLRDRATLAAFIARRGVVPVLGEAGVWDPVPIAARARWHAAVHRAFAPLGTGECVWAYTNTFAFWDQHRRAWHAPLLAAIGLDRRKAVVADAPLAATGVAEQPLGRKVEQPPAPVP